MHNHNDSHDRSMLWMMVVCCALPIALFLLGGTALAGNSRWLILGGLGILLLVHFLMMRRGHGGCCHSGAHDRHHAESAETDMKRDEKRR